MNESALYAIAASLQENMSDEGEAVKGYTELLEKISQAMDYADDEIGEMLKRLYEETEEKISDELNHQRSLLAEFVELTQIKIAED